MKKQIEKVTRKMQRFDPARSGEVLQGGFTLIELMK